MLRLISLIALSVSIPSTVLADDQADALALVHKFVASMNSGDIDSAIATCSDEMVIVDNVAPYQWQGAGACEKWAIAQEADSIAKGRSDIVFELGNATHFELSNGYAYAVSAAGYTFLDGQNKGRVEGLLTTSLHKTSIGWQMTGFAFSEQ